VAESSVDAEPAVEHGWFDSHCHVYDERLGPPDATIAEARAAGVTTMIVVGCDRATSIAARQLADVADDVHATVGLHPHEARHGVDTIVDLVGPDTVAIGECGLDYYYDHSPRDAQREAFAAQITLAVDTGLTLVVHTRDAWDDTFDVLDDAGVPSRVVFHCFTGGPDEARQALDRGAFLSFSGIVTFKGAAEVREAALLCPADRLLIETDSPYLAPVPHRGKLNRPAWVPAVGACLAELRGVPVSNVRSNTAEASRSAFPGTG
jgi:TatD DNase family protein